jgi:endonuclease YncB( thermonuclease family)
MHLRSFAPLAFATATLLLPQLFLVLQSQPALAGASISSRNNQRKEHTLSTLWRTTKYPTATRGTVISITDGDTLTVACDGVPEKIRLVDVDAPEKSQPFGRAAKKYLSDLAYMHEVTIARRGHDRYGRTLATITLVDTPNATVHSIPHSGPSSRLAGPSSRPTGPSSALHQPTVQPAKSVNADLLAAGYAWVYRGKAQDPQFKTLEASAREAHRGLWSDKSALPPWEYRKLSKQHTATHQNDQDALIHELAQERVRTQTSSRKAN